MTKAIWLAGAAACARACGPALAQGAPVQNALSADAARQIKALIGTSTDKVALGSNLVEQAGQTMEQVVAGIRQVSTMVASISAASQEQSHGVGQVGQAVSHLDQATQQNAALVEEGAAAAESLKQQAAQLVEAVAAFKLAAH